jgi:hypothetical protein
MKGRATLRKEREEWGTHFVFCAGSLKAGPPALQLSNLFESFHKKFDSIGIGDREDEAGYR